MMAAAWRQLRARDIPLGAQIVALLLAGLVVAQISTLVLTVLLPPSPAPKYRMVEVARALQGGPLKVSNPRPLVRVVRNQPPSLESPDWVISEQSRADLARFVGAPVADVRILFYSPLPLSRGGGAISLARNTTPDSLPATASASERPKLLLASMVTFADVQMGPGGGSPSGGFQGGGFGSAPSHMPNIAPPPQMRPATPLPSRPAPQTQTGSQPQPASAAASTLTPASTPDWTPQAHAVQAQTTQEQTTQGQAAQGQARSGVENATPPSGLGTAGQPPQGGTAPTGAAGRPSSSGSTGRPDEAVRSLLPPPQARAPEPIFAPTPTAPMHDAPPARIQPPAETISPPTEANAASDAVKRPEPPKPAEDTSQSPPGPTPAASDGFALTPADRGGYILPSQSAPVRGLLGVPTMPYLQGDFVAALQASPGHWITVQPAPEPFPNTWQRRIMLWFFLSSIVVIPVGLVFARRLAAPLATFAEAAERLGRDPSGKQAPLNGPAEIGRAAHAFNQMQARLKRYIDDRTAMVGAISHDLRTPLARMRFRLERIPPQFHDGMAHDIAQMEEMITSVLAFIRDVNEPSVRDRVELRSILECVVDNAALMGGDVTLDPGERVPVDVDSLGIERVLTNLIDNALKYGDKAHVRVFQDGTDVVTEVEDEGPGLPMEELERVFLPFYRSDHSRNLNKTGIGLGLAVSRSIARAHGGDINLSPGTQGLRVQLRLPRASAAMAAS